MEVEASDRSCMQTCQPVLDCLTVAGSAGHGGMGINVELQKFGIGLWQAVGLNSDSRLQCEQQTALCIHIGSVPQWGSESNAGDRQEGIATIL